MIGRERMLKSSCEQNILDTFLALTQALTTLNYHIRQDLDKVIWIQDNPILSIEKTSPREKLIAIINQLYYTPQQPSREIVVCAGFVGASFDTLAAASHVNDCKEQFKQEILSLPKKLSVNEIILQSPSTSSILKNVGLSRLHLKQCYRKIPILKDTPSKISWTWAHTRSIKKISLQTAQTMLLKRGNDQELQIQLQKLCMLQPNESLAIVQELAPHLRANLVFTRPEGNIRTMIKAPIPIFFPAQASTSTPQFTIPREKQGKNTDRMIRSDVKLDPSVFLPAIRAHRYLR